jgi:mono/diheme cytochrome c family protein
MRSVGWLVGSSLALLSCSPFALGQNRPTGAVEVLEGNQIFVVRCGGCHGADARGSDRGPALAGFAV